MALVHDYALQVVNLVAVDTLHAQLLREGNPIIKFLLLERLRVDAKALQVHKQHLGIMPDYYFFGGDLPRQTRFAHQFVVKI